MDDARRVDVLQRAHHALHDLDGERHVELVRLDVPLEAAAVDELHHHVVLHADGAVLVGADDVDVVQALRHLRLAVEAADELRVGDVLLHGDLERHDLPVALAPGAVHARHPAGTDLLEQFVAGDLGRVERRSGGALRLVRVGRPFRAALGRRDAGAADRLDPHRHEQTGGQGGDHQRREGAVDAAQERRRDAEHHRQRTQGGDDPGRGPQQQRDQHRGDHPEHDHASTSAMTRVMLSGPPRSLARAMSTSTQS